MALCLIALAPTAIPPPHGGLIEATIKAPNGQKPQSARVRVEPLKPGVKIHVPPVAHDGTFKMRLPAGNYLVSVQNNLNDPKYMAFGGNYAPRNVHVTEGGDVHVELGEPPKAERTLVRVLRANGRPAPNLALEYSYVPGVFSSRTDESGRATISTSKQEAKQLWFRAQEGDEFSAPAVFPRNGTATVQLHRVPLGAIQGRVTDAAGRPIPNAKIEWEQQSPFPCFFGNQQLKGSWNNKKTGPDGRYRFVGLYPGVRLRIGANDNLHANANPLIATATAGKTITLPTLILNSAGVLKGRVVDQLGRPVFGARVFVQNTHTHPAKTDRQGRFQIPQVPFGIHRLGILFHHKEFHPSGATGTDQIYAVER
jgi:hypothetical protein